jgi:hypothetical protein
VPPTNYHNAKPNYRTNPYELFRAFYHKLFDELETCTDRARRREIVKDLKRKAHKAGVQLGRNVK